MTDVDLAPLITEASNSVLYFCTVSKGLEDFTVNLLTNDPQISCNEVFSPCPGKVFFSSSSQPQLILPSLKTVERFGIVVSNFGYDEFYPCSNWKSARIAHAAKALVEKMDWCRFHETMALAFNVRHSDSDAHATAKLKTYRISAKVSRNRFGNGVDSNRLCRQLAFDFQSHIDKFSTVGESSLKDRRRIWKATVRDSALEFYVHFGNTSALVGVFLTDGGSLAERPYLRHFGTRSTLAFVIAKLAFCAENSLILDPFCGVSAVLIECHHLNPSALYLGIDSDPNQLTKSLANKFVLSKHNAVVSLDFTQVCSQSEIISFPLRAGCVDRIVSDIPHGRRYGPKFETHDKSDLISFYRSFLAESFRVLSDVGEMILLLSKPVHQLLSQQILDQSHSDRIGFQEKSRLEVAHGRSESVICVFVKK